MLASERRPLALHLCEGWVSAHAPCSHVERVEAVPKPTNICVVHECILLPSYLAGSVFWRLKKKEKVDPKNFSSALKLVAP